MSSSQITTGQSCSPSLDTNQYSPDCAPICAWRVLTSSKDVLAAAQMLLLVDLASIVLLGPADMAEGVSRLLRVEPAAVSLEFDVLEC